ncbi:MAG TPA: GNAT family N-acetyltransferase [Nocardioidaceae bacterium]|jgi:predicted GNAT superfamily acetyltransferase|nr:GNAT family N-acetyltransferase [Nocardioidaceae bacterium]
MSPLDPGSPGPDGVRLRPLAPTDHADVLRLNEHNVEALAPMDEERLHQLGGWADRFDVLEVDGAFAGFVVTFGPGSAYDSENYRWFHDRYGGRFYYLDRIVLEPHFRRRGLGGFVYADVEATAVPCERLALEVNLVPRNDASLAFHAGRGYAEVGRLGDDTHLVSLMTKEL